MNLQRSHMLTCNDVYSLKLRARLRPIIHGFQHIHLRRRGSILDPTFGSCGQRRRPFNIQRVYMASHCYSVDTDEVPKVSLMIIRIGEVYFKRGDSPLACRYERQLSI